MFGIYCVGIKYNFFDFGGNFICVMVLVVRIYKELDVNLFVKDIFKFFIIE